LRARSIFGQTGLSRPALSKDCHSTGGAPRERLLLPLLAKRGQGGRKASAVDNVFVLTLGVAVAMVGAALVYSARVFRREHRRQRRRIERLHRYLAG
jgi:hypothetical protein